MTKNNNNNNFIYKMLFERETLFQIPFFNQDLTHIVAWIVVGFNEVLEGVTTRTLCEKSRSTLTDDDWKGKTSLAIWLRKGNSFWWVFQNFNASMFLAAKGKFKYFWNSDIHFSVLDLLNIKAYNSSSDFSDSFKCRITCDFSYSFEK